MTHRTYLHKNKAVRALDLAIDVLHIRINYNLIKNYSVCGIF